MVDYISTLVSVALAASLSGFVAYRGTDRWHKLSVSIILLSVIATPLFGLISEIPDTDFSELFKTDVEVQNSDEFERVGKEAFENGMRTLIAEKFGIPEASVCVKAESYDAFSMKAELIRITLVGEGFGVDYKSMESYVRGLGLGLCEVRYGLG